MEAGIPRSEYQQGLKMTLFQTADVSLFPHMVDGVRESLSGPFYNATNPIHEGPTLMT